MDKKHKEQLIYNTRVKEVSDKFEQKSFDRKVNLLSMRHELTVEMISLRDKVCQKRFNERKYLLEKKDGKV